ncbi:MAG: EAL and HDOD domain-containing protein [Terriglobales bacterium]
MKTGEPSRSPANQRAVVPPGAEGCTSQELVARQPIFDDRQRIYGYELLFRYCQAENFYDGLGSDPSLSVISNSVLFHDLSELVDNRKAFINLNQDGILDDSAMLLPKGLAVVEILESVEPNAAVLAALCRLKTAGYLLALDDVSSCDRVAPFVGLVQFAKVDLSLTTIAQQRELAHYARACGIIPIAEKVETRKQFRESAAMDFKFFQGYFFAQPEIMTRRDMPVFKVNYLRFLEAIHRPDLDLQYLEKLIRSEESFVFKLLRYLNSPIFGFRHDIRSIQHAITLLGEKEVRRWASMVAITTLASDKPDEIALTSLRRAFMCELLAELAGMAGKKDSLFLVGLLSTIDAILDRPLGEILAQLPINDDIKSALLDGRNEMASVLQLTEAYDRANWREVLDLAQTLRLAETKILPAYMMALALSRKVVQAVPDLV